MSEYTALCLAANYLGKEGFVQAVEDVQQLETRELTGIQTKPAAQEAYETWRLLIEYAKLSAVARGMDDPVRPSFKSGMG